VPIEPDIKDWTWVLERPCEECGFDTSTVVRGEVGSSLRGFALGWHEVLNGAVVARRPSDDVWSPLEYGCHVRDVIRLYTERLALMLTRDAPTYENWDQDATAIEDRYGEQDPATVADEVVVAAERLAAMFDGVAPDGWDRTGTRSDGAHFTVDTFARYFLHDVAHHLHDVGHDQEMST